MLNSLKYRWYVGVACSTVIRAILSAALASCIGIGVYKDTTSRLQGLGFVLLVVPSLDALNEVCRDVLKALSVGLRTRRCVELVRLS